MQDESALRFTWAVVRPSAVQTVLHLNSEIVTAVAQEIECRQYLALVREAPMPHPSFPLTWTASLVEPTNRGPLPPTYLPIWPCNLGSREPLRPGFDWPLGDCVVNTAAAAFFPLPQLVDTRNIPHTLSQIETTRFDSLLHADIMRGYNIKHAAQKATIKAEREADGFSSGSCSIWTSFSKDSKKIPARPGELFPPSLDVSAEVVYDISALDQFGGWDDWQEDRDNILRLVARFSYPSGERTIRWIQETPNMICITIPTDGGENVSDLNCPPFVEFAAQAHREPSPERPRPRSAEQELAASNGDDRPSLPDDNGSADSWPGLAVPRVSESWWSPPTPITALPQVIYFDIYGTLIDKEAGIFAALVPLLSQSLYQFERREALSFYLESETEVKKRNPDVSYTQILAYTYEDVALRLGIQPESTGSSVFSRSIEGWPAIYAAEWCLATLRTITSITLIAIADVDRDSLDRTASFTLMRPHFHDVFTRDRCKFDTNKTQNRSGLAPAFVHTALNEHSAIALGIPRDQTCFVSNSLFDMEPARELGIPTVWARYPESLAGNVYYMEDEWPEVFVMFVGLVELGSSFLLLAHPRAENASDELDLGLLDPDDWAVPDDG